MPATGVGIEADQGTPSYATIPVCRTSAKPDTREMGVWTSKFLLL